MSYYEDNVSYRKHFGKYTEKYHFKGAFDGMLHHWTSREEFWGYLATFLYTTQTAPVRKPYQDLDTLLIPAPNCGTKCFSNNTMEKSWWCWSWASAGAISS